MKTALELIEEERNRQINEKGWTLDHDDTHGNHELPLMAAVFAMPASHRYPALVQHLCPWPDQQFPDPRDHAERERELVKAGALIVAEIERMQREADRRQLPTG